MFSKNSRLCAVLLSLSLFGWVPAFAGTDAIKPPGSGPECQGGFVEGDQASGAVMAKIVQKLAVPESRWAAWNYERQQGPFLATVDAGNVLRVFEPLTSPHAIYSAHWSSLGSGDQLERRAEWVEVSGRPAVQIGDERGYQRILFEPFGASLDPSTQSLGEDMASELHSFALGTGQWLTAFVPAEKKKDPTIDRIRIVPVGRTGGGLDLPVDGEVKWLSEHRSSHGVLLAVALKTELLVFRLDQANQLILKKTMALSDVRPSWVVDERGESLLVMGTAEGRLRVLFPESGEPGFETDLRFDDLKSVQVARDLDGVSVLALSASGADLVRIRDGEMVHSADVSNQIQQNELLTLISGPFTHGPMFASVRVIEGQRVLAFSDASPSGHVHASVAFDHAGESLRGVHELRRSDGRVQLAVRTDRRIYIVDLY
jgi:hypothetical protein